MKLETHCHSKKASFCSHLEPVQLVELNKTAGIDAFVMTNHYTKGYFENYPGQSFDDRIEYFLNEYRTAKTEGDKQGVHVLLGAEVAINVDDNRAEFLLFGTDEDFFYSNGILYENTQQSLYKLCADNNILMYQAHPLRTEQGHFPWDPEYLDGYEINLHPYFARQDDGVRELADKNNKGLTCGSDFHYDFQSGSGGIIVPNTVTTAKKLAEFLRQNPRPELYFRDN